LPWVFRRYGVHVGGCDPEIGREHKARAAIEGNVNDTARLTRNLPKLVQGIAKPFRVNIGILSSVISVIIKLATERRAFAQ
jgi:hypothetical protein